MKPKLSLIVTARNDDYGGNWVNRINAFIKVLIYQTNRLSLPCELVFVEYNPPADKKHIYEELTIENNTFLNIRFITVPNDFHQKLPDHEKVTVCEFIGKNIGMRRARGEWLVATNPDVLYGDDLFNFLASGKLDKNIFYRINRKDLSLIKVDPGMSAEEILKIAERNTIKVMYNNRTIYISWKEWFSALVHGRTLKILQRCPIFNPLTNKESDRDLLHENAAGDFLVLHREAVEAVRGYDQVTVGSGVLDGYILYVLYCKDYKQNILPYSLYHIYHHHKGVKYLASHLKFREDAKKMLATKTPYKINPVDWGFPAENFRETIR
jgi:hypothetical protein